VAVVDNDNAIRRLLRLFLTRAGYSTFECITGDDARQKLSTEPWDVAILDRKLVWPLRPVDVEALFPHISSKQLRDWDVEGLVPAYRWGPGKYRGYFRSQLVLALLVERMLSAGWGIEHLKQAIGLVPEPQREAVEDLQAVVVERRELLLV